MIVVEPTVWMVAMEEIFYVCPPGCQTQLFWR